MNTLEIALRPGTPADERLIYSSWQKSYRESEFGTVLPERLYYSHYKPVVDAIMARAQVVVACEPTDHAEIYGWLAHERGVVHYVYVKQPFRGAKVARRLLDAAGFTTWKLNYSHETRAAVALRRKHPEMRHTPYAIGGER